MAIFLTIACLIGALLIHLLGHKLALRLVGAKVSLAQGEDYNAELSLGKRLFGYLGGISANVAVMAVITGAFIGFDTQEIGAVFNLGAMAIQDVAGHRLLIGPIGLVAAGSNFLQNTPHGFEYIMLPLVFFYANIIIIAANLLPIPPLDLGRLIVLAVEKAGNRDRVSLLRAANIYGGLIIVVLMIFATVFDVMGLFGYQF